MNPDDIAGRVGEEAPEALIATTSEGRVSYWNRAAEALFGYAHGGLVGLPIECLMPEALRERHRGHRDAYMAAPRVRPMGSTDQSMAGRRLDGSEFPIEIALSPIAGADGTCYLASVRDICRPAPWFTE